MRGVVFALVLMLLHSFFSCEAAPFQVPDTDHSSFSHLSHFDAADQSSAEQQERDGEHEFHAHLSCHSGYHIDWPVTDKIVERVIERPLYYLPLRHQPPVPPPNFSYSA